MTKKKRQTQNRKKKMVLFLKYETFLPLTLLALNSFQENGPTEPNLFFHTSINHKFLFSVTKKF